MSHAVCPKCHAVVGVSSLGPVPHNCWKQVLGPHKPQASEPAQPAEPRDAENALAMSASSAEIKRLLAERDDVIAKLKATEWVLRDNALRTYDGLATRHDRYRDALQQIIDYEDSATLDGQYSLEEVQIIARQALKESK